MAPDIIEFAELAWRHLKPHLPPRREHTKGGRPFVDDKACLLGIVWVLRTGGRWRDLPSEVGVSYCSCWRRHVEWTASGAFAAAWKGALAELERRRPKAAREGAIDALFVRAKKGVRRSARPSAARG